MKKMISLVLMIAMLISVSAFAETGFDISLFENNSDYSVVFDEFNGSGIITSTKQNNSFHGFYHSNSDGQRSRMIPTIVLSNKGNGVINGDFVFYVYYNANTWLFMDKMQVKIDGTVYDCSVIPMRRDIQSGYISEALVLPINPSMGSTLMTEMMTALINTTEEIRIRFGGDKGNVDFTLPDNIHREIIDIYSLYNQACGLNVDAE